jgi:hypothetical protein
MIPNLNEERKRGYRYNLFIYYTIVYYTVYNENKIKHRTQFSFHS